MDRPPPLNAIHVFAACARIGSFKLAAEELCVTPGAVSRQVHALEEYLGFKLFDRQHRKVQLTHSGQLYFSQIAPALRTIEGAAENARPTSGRATLQVESTPTFTMHWLIPKLSEFQKCHPDIELQITTSSGPIVLRKDTQIYIRRDPVQFSGLEAEEFMSEVSLLVCSPSYIKKNPLMETKALPVLPVDNDMPLVERGGLYFNQPEQFNRYYTDKDYMPQRTLYVSPFGENADLETNSREAPASVSTAFANVQAGDQIYFLRNQQAYQGCYGLSLEQSGTYDDPIVLFAERNDDDTRGVKIECCESGRQSCINLEGANYIAIDGFELEGGHYGVRAVGLNYDSLSHQKGVAVINTEAHDNCKDPFFTGQSDWAVFENNIGHGAGSCDGHGIYISNGSDWNIVRNNELYENASSDFQINADPELTCVYSGIEYDDPQCDGPAELGQGRGASDYMHIEGNYFHNGYSQGPNFTSVRYSMVTHNIIGLYARHGTSFWQETSNPNLGSSENTIQDNLFIGENRRHVLQFINNSDRNEIKNNIFLGVSIDGSDVSVNRSTVLLDVDASVADNSYSGNYYISGQFDGYSPNGSEFSLDEFDPGWFTTFPYDRMGSTADWTPTESAPFGGFGGWSPPVSE